MYTKVVEYHMSPSHFQSVFFALVWEEHTGEGFLFEVLCLEFSEFSG